SPDGGRIEIDVLSGYRPLDPALRLDPSMPRLALLRPAHDPDARYAAIRVRDHGPGIARQQLPRLTERFYRVEGQKSGDRMGTGLGLAIVKHIVNRHRGGLIVESEPGQGSAFTVYLPQAPADPSPGRNRRRNKSVMQAS
ncbi:MAG TPA: ATP-binding protein, partial [Reyranella sp.]|nr:ATP-binding protein [Reyranella sp.]